jgi:uncharacterized RDD family membrane protein YckC
MFCPTCGQEALEQTNFCQYCGHPLHPEAQNRLSSTAPYAGFWRRFAALIIDEMFISIVMVGAEAVLGAILGVNIGLHLGIFGGKQFGAVFALTFMGSTLIHWLYWAGMESSAYQATLGKMALGLKVTDLQGEPISFNRATGRYFGKIISALLLGIGFLMAGWTEKKQALHDIMAGTLVVKKQGGNETA